VRHRPTTFFAAGALLMTAAPLGNDLFGSRAEALTFSEPITAISRTLDKARLAARRKELRLRASRSAALHRAARGARRLPPKPAVAASSLSDIGDDVFAKLRRCESGGRYNANSGNGYYGAYQFAPGTWRSLGYSGLPHDASPETQDEAARKLQARGGWRQWPACSRRIGAR
jgi:hypothetical protein